ncbi:MAG: hypothetical protein J6T45_00965, partial [Fibrobacterales bacterium]|nr:hypothetical protein [Fibrobacterales bacterium]
AAAQPAPAPAAPKPAPAGFGGFAPPSDEDPFAAAPRPIAAPKKQSKSSLEDRNAFFFGGDDEPSSEGGDVDEENVELRPYIPKKKEEAPSEEGG